MPPSETAASAVERSLAATDERDGPIRAWAHLDADLARRAARVVGDGPLAGLTFGVKDIFDTFDQPTEYGSPIYHGHRPAADAAVVAQLRHAGAVVLGKTVTTELAWVTPGPTRNPHRESHTPGGSSSGSVAAVAAGMVDFALGTQTAGSVIRPASFCGVWGLKPTFGLLPTSGVKQEAPSLDTVGLFSLDLATLSGVFSVLEPVGRHAASESSGGPSSEPLRAALVRTDLWGRADPDCQLAVEAAAAMLAAEDRALPPELVGLGEAANMIHLYEGARSYSFERLVHPDLVSPALLEILERGAALDRAVYAAAQRRVREARTSSVIEALFGSAAVLVAPSAVGEAPAGLSSTGDPSFNRLWTVLGCPTLNVPGLTGSSGLPIGIQLVARPYREEVLFQAGATLERAIARLDH